MAIGFDLYNTGEMGNPANTKFAWDAGAVGANGFAWLVSGRAPWLQVWVTNMDPTWGGQCSADECAIDGPPDGTPDTSIGSIWEMPFSSMVKDDWGDTGTNYTFSSSNILSLQFKVIHYEGVDPSYEICVDQLGIMR